MRFTTNHTKLSENLATGEIVRHTVKKGSDENLFKLNLTFDRALSACVIELETQTWLQTRTLTHDYSS